MQCPILLSKILDSSTDWCIIESFSKVALHGIEPWSPAIWAGVLIFALQDIALENDDN